MCSLRRRHRPDATPRFVKSFEIHVKMRLRAVPSAPAAETRGLALAQANAPGRSSAAMESAEIATLGRVSAMVERLSYARPTGVGEILKNARLVSRARAVSAALAPSAARGAECKSATPRVTGVRRGRANMAVPTGSASLAAPGNGVAMVWSNENVPATPGRQYPLALMRVTMGFACHPLVRRSASSPRILRRSFRMRAKMPRPTAS